jgi:hypothetical protein
MHSLEPAHLAAGAGEDRAALSGRPRKANAGQYESVMQQRNRNEPFHLMQYAVEPSRPRPSARTPVAEHHAKVRPVDNAVAIEVPGDAATPPAEKSAQVCAVHDAVVGEVTKAWHFC